MKISILVLSLALAGCATNSTLITQYDFGPTLRSSAAEPQVNLSGLGISVADANPPPGLGSPQMFFRLGYANQQQARPYANSRWSAAPAQLFTQRLKARLAQAGAAALPAGDGAANLPLLRIEADDFIQNFDSPTQSSAQIAIRAALYNGRNLIAQKIFTQTTPAPSADAAGGVRALTDGSDAVIAELLQWLAGLPLKK